jgi:Adenylate cyclase regulatory domain
MFTVVPNQSPSRSSAEPVCMPTRTAGNSCWAPTSSTIASPNEIAAAGWLREGLLEGLEEPERSARASLLQQLSDAGLNLAELKRAVAENRLALLPIQQLLDRNALYTMHDYVQQTGLDEELIRRNYLALGLPPPDPDARWFSDEQVAAGRVLK